ncbi:hypothetical protein L3X38_019985 [Prunus dulcis]|uniref:Uncharacterized protein n=1 Tax=Prunus dulcis TaxID=3755 RepID=A0AAD4WEI7_PRUDU|nr:hypothetical protein L3X38_019985 [Prunus dulcis]
MPKVASLKPSQEKPQRTKPWIDSSTHCQEKDQGVTLKFRAFIAFITAKSKSSNQFANSKSPIFSIRFSKHIFIQTSNPKFYSVSDSSASLSLSTHQDQSPSLSPSSFVPPISGEEYNPKLYQSHKGVQHC